ncbi:hypothetical protein QLX08_009508 [Tetragonisca angustula]|uniref:Uncharacterized protein n=1 Tax=Tetragonisca angustula TaxID=166442 RepID=A0AAW0ZHL2_9HYME
MAILEVATELTTKGVFNGATRTYPWQMDKRRCRYLERNLSPSTNRVGDRLGKMLGRGQAWGPVYRRGTRNREETRESNELPGPSPHYHAPRLPSHYLVVPIARSNFITDSRTDIPP